MKTINIISYSLFLLLGSASCSSILDENPQGIISDEDLNTVDKVEQMITAAYSFCGQNHFNKQFGMPYEEGSLVRLIKVRRELVTTQKDIFGKPLCICNLPRRMTWIICGGYIMLVSVVFTTLYEEHRL